MPSSGNYSLLPMLLGMRSTGFIRMISGMAGVALSSMRMMSRLLVLPTLVVLRSFRMMPGGVRVVLRSLLVMVGRLL
jgi:hypothetical protein